ncbi:MAG: GAF domain-containing sensor histidine kinase [Chloroflexi bacterium]|nr:GAF domain-containing sensor histidine kinase [Chloroflexota bacterium]
MNSQIESNKQTNLWRVVHVTWVVLALAALGMFAASLPAYALRAVGAQASVVYDAPPAFVRVITVVNVLASVAAALTSLGLAFVLFRRKPHDPMAMYVSFYLLAYGVVAAGPLGMLDGSRPMTESVAILAEVVLLTTPTITLFFIFPTGQFVPRWTRWASVLSVVWIGAGVALVRHPPSAFDFWSLSGLLLMILAWTCFAFYAPIHRYRRVSNLAERQQTKWVVFGMAIFLVLTALTTIPYFITQAAPRDAPQPSWALALSPVWWLSLSILPLSLTIAVMRYRLFDIDIIINRALVYGALTLSTMAIYVLVVGYVGNLFQSGDRSGLAFLATGLVALIFQPMRLWLQRIINRLLYGNRDNPAEVLSNLGKRLESVVAPDAILPAIVESIAKALRLPYVAVMLKEGTEFVLAADYGQKPTSNLTCERVPLNYRNEPIGQITVCRRGGEASFSSDEKALLENIAHQVSVAAYATQVTRDLQRSRERLVTAREEERRRLRRDLHDGLGPSLASLTLKLDAARNQLKQNPDQTDVLLGELKSQTQSAIEDIRRLVYNLRPPALDELGLFSAVQEYAANLGRAKLSVRIERDGEYPKLPAAVEVAAYRIICEALTNVAKHSQATECIVRLTYNGDLQIDVQDNGIGLPQGTHSGVGMFSMRERAAELGGTFTIQSNAGGGVHITANLPCEVATDEH